MSFSSPNTPAPAEPANLTPAKLDTNQQSLPLPYWFGRHWFPLTWSIREPKNITVTGKSSGGGKSSKSGTTQQTYKCDVAGHVACGMGDFLEAIEVNGKIVWSAGGGISRDGAHPEHTGDIVVADVGTFRLHWGTETGTGDFLILNDIDETHPYYRGQIVCEAKGLTQSSSGSVANIRVLLERAPRFKSLDSGRSYEGANAITALCEYLENGFYGYGLTDLVDEASAYALAEVIKARTKVVVTPGDDAHEARMGYLSGYITSRQSFASFLSDVLENFDGWVRRNGSMLEFGHFSHDGIDVGSLPEITLHDLVEDPKFSSLSFDDPSVYTDAVVNGPERDRNMEDSWQAGRNDVARERLKAIRLKTYERKFICTGYQQKDMAQSLADFFSVPAGKDGVKVRRERAGGLVPGERFILNYGPSSSRQVFRVTARRDAAGDGVAELTIELERALAPLPYVAAPSPTPTLPAPPPPAAITHARMFQLPVTWPGLTALPALVPLAERPSANSLGYEAHFSVDDSTYDFEATVKGWALRGVIDADSPAADDDGRVYLDLAGLDLAVLGSQSPAASGDNTLLLFCGDEVMSIGAVVAEGGGVYSMDVYRGVLGSLAAAHAAGVEVWIIPRADLVEITHAALPREGATRYFKLAAFTANETQELADALKLTVAVAATIPAAPVLAAAVVGTGKSVSLAWSASTLAAEYAIWRYTSNTPASAVKVAEVTALRFVDVDVVIGTAYWYWVTAIDELEQESPKSNGVTVTPATIAGTALDPAITTAITNAQTDATAANTALANIASDSILSPVEKPAVVLDYTNLTAEQSAIDAQATAFAITTEKTAYDTALAALTTYLGTLAGWNTIPGADVVIVGTTFRAKFADVYAARQTLLNLLAAKANPTAPSNPTAPATGLSSSATYLSADGTAFARLVVNNPAAMPAGAALINVLCRANGSSGYFVANQITAGGGTTTVDDLTPGVAYQIAFQAFSADGVGSAIVAATSSPFTAPTKTALPNNPTGFAVHAPSTSYPLPSRYTLGVRIPGCTITFTRAADRDIELYEYAVHPSTTIAPTSADGQIEATASQFFHYTFNNAATWLWIRAKDRSGNYSAWTYTGVILAGSLAAGAGSISTQDADAVAVTGISTGDGSSVRKVLARYQAAVVITLTGGAPTETANLDLTNRGFSTKPDVGTVVVEGTPYVAASYKYNDAGSTSTNAVLFFYSNPSSANLPAGANIVMVELIEYEP